MYEKENRCIGIEIEILNLFEVMFMKRLIHRYLMLY